MRSLWTLFWGPGSSLEGLKQGNDSIRLAFPEARWCGAHLLMLQCSWLECPGYPGADDPRRWHLSKWRVAGKWSSGIHVNTQEMEQEMSVGLFERTPSCDCWCCFSLQCCLKTRVFLKENLQWWMETEKRAFEMLVSTVSCRGHRPGVRIRGDCPEVAWFSVLGQCGVCELVTHVLRIWLVRLRVPREGRVSVRETRLLPFPPWVWGVLGNVSPPVFWSQWQRLTICPLTLTGYSV